MDDSHAARAPHRPILDAQLRLIEQRRADVAALLEPGGERDEAHVDRVANDLVGVRLTVRAALAAPPPAGVTGAARDGLQRPEREACDLLRAVLAFLLARRLAGSST